MTVEKFKEMMASKRRLRLIQKPDRKAWMVK